VSVLVMALGIGATTSLFTIVRAVLLRPLPFRDPSNLVMLYEHYCQNTDGDGFNAVAPGVAASALATQLVRSMLYGTRPLDPAAFAGAATMLVAVAVLACLIPAWRASRIDPVQALRTE
jgi:ABC-type antimicrobial peptide transport system permease subunit